MRRDAHTPAGDLLSIICLDDYTRTNRAGEKKRMEECKYDPESEDLDCDKTDHNPKFWQLDLMVEQVAALKGGKQIMKPIYSHQTHKNEPAEPIEPNHIMILEGLWLLDKIDLSVYVDIDPAIQFAWKSSRDIKDRGWTEE